MVGQNEEIIDPTGRVWSNTVVVACRDWLDCHGHDSGRYGLWVVVYFKVVCRLSHGPGVLDRLVWGSALRQTVFTGSEQSDWAFSSEPSTR